MSEEATKEMNTQEQRNLRDSIISRYLDTAKKSGTPHVDRAHFENWYTGALAVCREPKSFGIDVSVGSIPERMPNVEQLFPEVKREAERRAAA